MNMGQEFDVEVSITCERSPFWQACLGKRPFRLWKGVRDVITKSPINLYSFFETTTTTGTTSDSGLCTILRCSFLSHALRLTLKFGSTAVWPLRSQSKPQEKEAISPKCVSSQFHYSTLFLHLQHFQNTSKKGQGTVRYRLQKTSTMGHFQRHLMELKCQCCQK